MNFGENMKNKYLKACCIHYGRGHMMMTAGKYLLDRIKAGEKVIVFSEKDVRRELEKFQKIVNTGNMVDNLDKSIMQYPISTVNNIVRNTYVSRFIVKAMNVQVDKTKCDKIIILLEEAGSFSEETLAVFERIMQQVDIPIEQINCYEFFGSNEDMEKIKNEHEYIVNTFGLTPINYVFEGYDEKSN